MGVSTGGFSGPGLARWCADSGLLELTAMHQDSALGIAIRFAGAPVAGGIPIGLPDTASARRTDTAAADTTKADTTKSALAKADTTKTDTTTTDTAAAKRPRVTIPHATIAVRWLDSTLLAAFRGRDGEVRLTEVGARVAGTVAARLSRVPGTGGSTVDTLAVTARFSGVPVVPSDSACGPRRASPDSGVT